MAKRLLLVEDDVVLARAASRLLTRAGYEVVVATRIAEAWQADGLFDAGIFDIELPDGNGIDLAAEMLARHFVKRGLFFTGSIDSALLERATRTAPVVQKSSGVAALKTELQKIMAKRRQMVVGAEGASAESTTPPPSGIRKNGDD